MIIPNVRTVYNRFYRVCRSDKDKIFFCDVLTTGRHWATILKHIRSAMRPWLSWIERLATDQKVGGSNPSGRARKETTFVYRQRLFLFNEINPLRDLWNTLCVWNMASPCKMPAGVGGFISFHFPRKRKISQWSQIVISHPKDISLHNPSFLLYNQFDK